MPTRHILCLYTKDYQKIPPLFQSPLSISVEECNAIVEKIEKIYTKAEKKRLSRKNRKRAIGAGRRFSLNIRDRVLLTLFYFRTYSSQRLVAFVFGTGQAIVSRTVNHMVPLLKKCIPIPAKIHNKTKRLSTVEELDEIMPGLRLLIDASV